MAGMAKKLIIFDPGFFKKSLLQDILAKYGFDVRVTTDIDGILEQLKDFGPEMILFRVTSKMYKNDSLLDDLRILAEENNVPCAVISSGSDIDFYLKSLESGMSHIITTPLGGESFAGRIGEIIDEKNALMSDDAQIRLDLSYGGKDYSFSVTPSRLAQFIVSLLHDSVNQSQMLADVIHRKHSLHQKVCNPELFEGTRMKTEVEFAFEKDMFHALDRSEFTLHYQPVISLADDRIFSFEALIRWNHPKRGLLHPSEFIPFAEKLPIIVPLGFWIIEEAARQIGQWKRRDGIDYPILIGVNLSANQFVNPDLSSWIVALINKTGIDPALIAFEITESAFMTDMELANIQLLKLKSNNHLIYMDDFGTGYSSLSYLQHFPVDTIKIDQSFVRWMHIDEQSEQIVRSVVGLAHNLKMKVVAEGVEEDEHRVMLKDLKCDYGQGFLFAPPLDPTGVVDYIKKFNHR